MERRRGERSGSASPRAAIQAPRPSLEQLELVAIRGRAGMPTATARRVASGIRYLVVESGRRLVCLLLGFSGCRCR